MPQVNGNTRPMGYVPPPRTRAPVEDGSIARAKMGRKSPPPQELKTDKFLRLGSARMKSTLAEIRLIGNLARRDVYDYTPEQVTAIKTALYAAVNETVDQFDQRPRGIDFKFPVIAR